MNTIKSTSMPHTGLGAPSQTIKITLIREYLPDLNFKFLPGRQVPSGVTSTRR